MEVQELPNPFIKPKEMNLFTQKSDLKISRESTFEILGKA